MKRQYTPPPNAVYNIGRRKAKCTMCIRYIKSLTTDSDAPELLIALKAMEDYKVKLDTI